MTWMNVVGCAIVVVAFFAGVAVSTQLIMSDRIKHGAIVGSVSALAILAGGMMAGA